MNDALRRDYASLAPLVISRRSIFCFVERFSPVKQVSLGRQMIPLHTKFYDGRAKQRLFPIFSTPFDRGLDRTLNEQTQFVSFLGSARDFSAAGQHVKL